MLNTNRNNISLSTVILIAFIMFSWIVLVQEGTTLTKIYGAVLLVAFGIFVHLTERDNKRHAERDYDRGFLAGYAKCKEDNGIM